MTKGQIWRNKRNGQLERINRVRWNQPTVLTEHYLRERVSGPVGKSDLEKVSHREAIDYVQEQRKFKRLNLPPLPLAAGV